VISGFRHEVDENCALLGYYAASSGNFLQTFGTIYRSHLKGSRIQTCGFAFNPHRLPCLEHCLRRWSMHICAYTRMFYAAVLITSGMTFVLAAEYVHTASGVPFCLLNSVLQDETLLHNLSYLYSEK
jgi:hypothetical protein